jgi:hypothetical protein
MTKDDLDLDLQAGGKALTFEEAIAHYPEQAAKAFRRVGAECIEQTEAKEAAYEQIRKLSEDLLQQKTLNADSSQGRLLRLPERSRRLFARPKPRSSGCRKPSRSSARISPRSFSGGATPCLRTKRRPGWRGRTAARHRSRGL